MARFPGTETQTNKAGWASGDRVRCRRSRANGSLGLADAIGFLIEVRATHVCVLLSPAGRSVWLESSAVLPHGELDGAAMTQLHEVFCALSGRRMEFEEGGFALVFSEGHPASAVDAVRSALGDRLVGYDVAAHGVHEMVSRLQLAPESTEL